MQMHNNTNNITWLDHDFYMSTRNYELFCEVKILRTITTPAPTTITVASTEARPACI